MTDKKITPTGDRSWYCKWLGSICLVTGLSLRSAEVYPYDLYFTLLGSVLWTYVGMVWRDRAIMIVNAIYIGIVLMGLVK